MCTDHDVLDDCHVFKQSDILKCPRNAQCSSAIGFEHFEPLVLECDFTGIGSKSSAQDVKERSLAGPIGSDHRVDVSFLDIDSDIPQCIETTKTFGETLGMQSAMSTGFRHL